MRKMKISIFFEDVPSLNKFYESKHWTYRAKQKDHYSTMVLSQLSTQEKPNWNQIKATLLINHRMDVDNSIMAVKFALDAFRRWGGVTDDSPKHLKKISLEVNEELPKNTALLIIEEYSTEDLQV